MGIDTTDGDYAVIAEALSEAVVVHERLVAIENADGALYRHVREHHIAEHFVTISLADVDSLYFEVSFTKGTLKLKGSFVESVREAGTATYEVDWEINQ